MCKLLSMMIRSHAHTYSRAHITLTLAIHIINNSTHFSTYNLLHHTHNLRVLYLNNGQYKPVNIKEST